MNIKKCDTLTSTFHYVNKTNKNLFIDTIKSSCGCTEVEYPLKPIAPKDSGYVKVMIDMNGIDGYFSKTVGVYFQGQKPVVLKVMGKTI